MRRNQRQESDFNRFQNQGQHFGRNSDWNRTDEHFEMGYDSDRYGREEHFPVGVDFMTNRPIYDYGDHYGFEKYDSRIPTYTDRGYGRGRKDRFDPYDSNDDWRHRGLRSRDYEERYYDLMRSRGYGDMDYDSDRYEGDRYHSFNSGFAGKGPKGYKRSDERIREEVCEALQRDDRVDASEIEVSVKEGTVTLRGTVNDRESKRRAESSIEYLSGVHDVQNEIRVSSNMQRNELDTGKKLAS